MKDNRIRGSKNPLLKYYFTIHTIKNKGNKVVNINWNRLLINYLNSYGCQISFLNRIN